MKRTVAILYLVAVGSGVVHGATVTFWVSYPTAGNYEVRTTVSSDCGGLALFSFTLGGGVTTISNMSPLAAGKTPTSKVLSPQAGFTMFRSGIGTYPANPVGAAQDNVTYVADPIYHVGQQAIDMTETWSGPYYVPADGQVAANALLAGGTCSGNITVTASRTGQTLWISDQGTTTQYPDTAPVIVYPEPATLALVAGGALLALRRRRG